MSEKGVGSLGGKAYRLLLIKEVGFNVPQFICLDAESTRSLFKSALDIIKNKFKNNVSDGDLLKYCEEAKELILNCEISISREKTILDDCLKAFGEDYMVSIRSSAIDEDNEEASFAGQYESFLYIRENGLIQAIRQCMASYFNFNAMAYRRLKGLSLNQMDFAIMIQAMVDASRSGVCFSMNTQGNLADTAIVGAYGAGEGVVQDKADTDTYYVNRGVRSIRRQIKLKNTALYFDGNALKEGKPELEYQRRAVLSDDEILAVTQLAMDAEQFLGRPADIEFVYDKVNTLYLLQVRPITTIKIDNLHVLDNTNIVESYPGITSPLSFSFARDMYERLFRRSAKAFWVSPDGFEKGQAVFGNLIAHFYGRVYYRLDNWYRMMALVYNSKSSLKAWEDAVGLPDSAVNSLKFSFIGKLKTAVSVIWLILNYRRGNNRFFKHFNEAYSKFRSYKSYSNPLDLNKHLEDCLDEGLANWHLTIVNDYLAFKTFGWLKHLIRRYKISENDDFANELVCAYGEVESEQAVMNLLEIKEYVNRHHDLMSLFERDNLVVINALNEKRFPDFIEIWDAYLDRFGDRTLAELKLETPAPRTHPELLVNLVKSQLGNSLHAAGFKEKQLKIRQSAEKVLDTKFKWFDPRRIILIYVRRLAAYGLMNRENMRFCRTRMYGAVKDIYLKFGEMMLKNGYLEATEDIFWLEMDEIKTFALDFKAPVCGTFANLINERKRQYSYYENLNIPDRIIYPDGEKPDPFHFERRDAETDADAWTATDYSNGCLKGTAVSKGEVEGEALVILDPVLNANVKDKILVCKMTDPGWVFLMSQAKALVSEKGSLLSHTAIVGRELGIPVVVAVTDACTKIKSGDKIVVNGSKGTVEWVKA